MATITVDFSKIRPLEPQQQILAESIARAMMTDKEVQTALQDLDLHPNPQHFESAASAAVLSLIALDLDLNPSAQHYQSAATAVVMALIALQLEALKSGDK